MIEKIVGDVPAGSVLHLGRTKLKVSDGDEVTLELHGEITARREPTDRRR
jgi:hypothetical protein